MSGQNLLRHPTTPYSCVIDVGICMPLARDAFSFLFFTPRSLLMSAVCGRPLLSNITFTGITHVQANAYDAACCLLSVPHSFCIHGPLSAAVTMRLCDSIIIKN